VASLILCEILMTSITSTTSARLLHPSCVGRRSFSAKVCQAYAWTTQPVEPQVLHTKEVFHQSLIHGDGL
jgi:hypothetical protein